MLVQSQNAVYAKVHALYGKRLKNSDYDQMLQKKSMAEVTVYLKNETYYAENLQEVKEDLIHRGQLENLVRKRVLDTYEKLLKYAYQETLFLTLFAMKNEIEQIITVIRLLNSGSMDRYIISFPAHLDRLMSFDLFALAKVKTFDDLLGALEHSPYYRIVGSHRPSGAHHIVDITMLETVLLTYYYRTALDAVNEQYSGQTLDDVSELIRYQLNAHNVSVIYRMRRYLNAPRDMTEKRIVRIAEGNNRLFDRLLDAPDLASMQQVVAGMRHLRHYSFAADQVLSISSQNDMVRRQINRRVFRFSQKPAIAVISYMAMLETEINNIIHIIEGIRYGMPPDEIRALLSL